jgi:putative addiction module CopG family antidote
VKSGTYESASEVIRDSLRALQERENAADEAFWHSVRDKVAVARRQLAEGRGLDGEAVMAELIAEASQDQDENGAATPRARRATTATKLARR